jgi:RimJ/RimL family protein N-acetyltransferase
MSAAAPPCTIRPWRKDDLDALVRHADDPAVAAQLRDIFPHPYPQEAGLAWLEAAADMQGTAFAIDAGEAVGGIGLTLGGDVERVSAEVGYWVGRAYWGKGIATHALELLVAHAFANFELTRLFAVPFAHNAPSRRVLEKAGFSLDCVLRRSAVKGGAIVDQALYSLVRG